MRRFVVVGRRAVTSPDFSLADLPGTSGRLDILLRCVRAALLVSHGVRRDTVVYLVLLGGSRAPRTLRFEGASVAFLRPDERALATLVMKALATPSSGPAFVDVRPGIAIADAGIEAALRDMEDTSLYLLDERGEDLREHAFGTGDVAFVLGDHLGVDDETREQLRALGAKPIGVGPVSVHADDAVVLACNELDRRDAKRAQGSVPKAR